MASRDCTLSRSSVIIIRQPTLQLGDDTTICTFNVVTSATLIIRSVSRRQTYELRFSTTKLRCRHRLSFIGADMVRRAPTAYKIRVSATGEHTTYSFQIS